jgi:hypothetical protein
MKAFTIAPLLAVLATGVVARNCTPGLFYCGYDLASIGKPYLYINKQYMMQQILTDFPNFSGNYGDQITQAMYDSGHNGQNPHDVIFYCEGGDSGIIKYVTQCRSGCHENPAGVSDVCNP